MEFFADTDRAELFAPVVDRIENVIVPVIVIYEVAKKLLRTSEELAARAISLLKQGVVDIDTAIVTSRSDRRAVF
jgi:toxin FitB